MLGESAAEPGAARPDADVRNNIRERLPEAFGHRAYAIFFARLARKGTAHAGSDWDIAVVLCDPVEDWVAESR